jgi:DNA ligase (NAD+)
MYDASNADGSFATEFEKIKWLEARGFTVAVTKKIEGADAASDVIAYRKKLAAQRLALPYDIDGLVVKSQYTDMEDMKRARPTKQIAFKFELEEAVSILKNIEWSESGATYTPIGIIEPPVKLAGTVVRQASLNNPNQISTLGLEIGCPIVVVKRGEIIPKIIRRATMEEAELAGLSLAASAKFTAPVLPVRCSVCDTELVNEGTRLYCPEPTCPKRAHHRLKKWVSVLDIRELGENLLRQLFVSGRVKSITDLYTLKAEELKAYEYMGELSAVKVVKNIMTARVVPLPIFVAGFDIEDISVGIMEKVCFAGFDTLEKLRTATLEQLADIDGLGQVTAASVVTGLAECAREMDAVLECGIISIAQPVAGVTLALHGVSVCFTGELSSLKRPEAQALVRNAGGIVKEKVVKGLTYLVTNDASTPSAKNKRAAELGIKIIDEKAFLELLGGEGGGVAKGELF